MKIIKVKSCLEFQVPKKLESQKDTLRNPECPFAFYDGEYLYCGFNANQGKDLDRVKGSPIPDWCPLDDAASETD